MWIFLSVKFATPLAGDNIEGVFNLKTFLFMKPLQAFGNLLDASDIVLKL